jgi:potassium-transporting ATPase potassium-binding subunit
MLAALAVAGHLVGRSTAPAGAGTLRTDTPSVGVILAGVVVLLALLNYLPALMLGPLAPG